MSKPPASKLREEDITIGRRTLVIALDETGQEEFKDKPGPLGKSPNWTISFSEDSKASVRLEWQD
jgi:hypothetical protein